VQRLLQIILEQQKRIEELEEEVLRLKIIASLNHKSNSAPAKNDRMRCGRQRNRWIARSSSMLR